MDFEKEIIEEKEPFDFIEKDPEIFEEPEQEFTKSGTKAVSDPPQYFTNIDGIYAKDVDGRAETAELRTMIDGTYVRAYTVMPVIEQTMLGQIAQYVGTTDSTYTQGYFYIASSDGATEPTYSWINLPTSPRTYSETVLFENDSMSPTSGTSNVTHTYTLSESIDNYDAVIVFVWGHCQMLNNVLTYNQGVPLLIPKSLYYLTGATAYPSWAFVANASISDASRRLCFSFTDSTHLFSEAVRTQSGVEPIVYKVIGIKY